MRERYILNEDGQPVPCEDLLVWAREFGKSDRIVAQDRIGDVLVSTVFLGLNHNFGGGAPILYETMVFGGPLDGEMERYETRAQAEAGHARMVEKVTQAQA